MIELYKNQSIRRKLVLLIFGVSSVALIMTFAILSYERFSSLKSDLKKTSQIQARLIGEYCVLPLFLNDIDELNQILQKIEVFDEIISAAVYDSEGKRVTFQTNKNSSFEPPPNEIFESDLKSGLQIIASIAYKNEVYGHIHLYVSVDKLKRNVTQHIVLYLMIIIGVGIFVYFITNRFQRLISEPILELSEITKDISNRPDYTIRLKKKYNDEIGQLYDNFNKMIDQIEKRSAERDKALQDISFQYERFLTILDSFPQSIYIVDPENYVIQFANSKLELSADRPLMNEKCYKVLYGFDAPCDFCNMKELSAHKNSITWEFLNPKTMRHNLLTDKLLKWPDGRTVRMEVATDISQRINAEKNVLESEKRLQGIIDYNPDAIIIVDTKNVIKFVNHAASELYESSKKDLIDTELETTFDLNGIRQEKIQSRKGENRIVEVRANNITWKDKKAFLVLHRDITDKVKDQAERKKLEKQLQHSQRMESIGNLAGGIAHDFNNILTPIVGMTDLLLHDFEANSPMYETLEEIYLASIRGKDLVQQILAFSRQNENKLIPLRIQQILLEVLKLSRSSIPTIVEMKYYVQPNCGLVLADPIKIHQILMNLITNAYHAIGENDGLIYVRLNEEDVTETSPGVNLEPGKYAKIQVEDNGTGIDPGIIDKIFDPYFTTKEQGKGTGLGLAVVYGIVKEHNGDITFQTEIGKGTCFNIYLPIMKKTVEKKTKKEKEEVVGGNETLLIVDDEQSVLKLEDRILKRLGYTVESYNSSKAALDAFEENPQKYDLIITDMNMPVMTGEKLAKRIMEVDPEMSIILCTGFSDVLSEEHVKEIGVKRLVMKPIIMADLAKVVRQVLDDSNKKKSD